MVVVEMGDAASGSSGRNEGLVVMGRYYHNVFTTVLKHLSRKSARGSIQSLTGVPVSSMRNARADAHGDGI